MDYSDDSSGSESDGNGDYSSFAIPMMPQHQQRMMPVYPQQQAVPQFADMSSSNHQTDLAEQYSDMESEEEEDAGDGTHGGLFSQLHVESDRSCRNYGGENYYSDMDDSKNGSDGSEGFDLTINYAELFPIAESEQRATQIVANRRLEKDKSELVGGRNQDYLGLAREYRFHRKFSDPRSNPPCVLCHSRTSQDVFFPCEHRCVCRECIRNENFCDERELQSKKDGYSLCPVCANGIKIIIPFDHGREVAKYWAWVEEVVPPLPAGFKRKFLRSAEVLHEIYVEKSHHDIIDDTLCKQS